MTKYEYEYYSVSQKRPNTNIIWLPKNDQFRIQILFGFPKKEPNTNTKIQGHLCSNREKKYKHKH